MPKPKKGNIEAAWAKYGIQKPELLDDSMVERMWQAYRDTNPKPKPEIRDFMRQIKHIERHGAEQVVTYSKQDSVFIGIVMTTMNRVNESQGLGNAEITSIESLADDGVTHVYEYKIDAVPAHFSDVIGLMVRMRKSDCALSGTTPIGRILINPSVPTTDTNGMAIH